MAKTVYRNQVKLRGIVISKRMFNSGELVVTVSDTINKADNSNYPHFIFFGEQAVKINKEINAFDHVDVEGTIQSGHVIVSGRPITKQDIYGTDIKKTAGVFEDDELGIITRATLEPYNRVVLAGVISGIVARQNMIVITIRTAIPQSEDGNDVYTSYVRCAMFGRYAVNFAKNHKKGEEVVAIGAIHTPVRKDEAGRETYYEDIVLTELHSLMKDVEVPAKNDADEASQEPVSEEALAESEVQLAAE